ncbi:MAG: flagellar basal body rod protein FlgC [Xanthobacteraceae bacterium]|nr:flagellar basal body rod protein FlgC [Xanthobacteraceae bacterium]QYK44053.1 MAG: flagellar basal body rod protein FlgC [Xanthobacteraceae bacterium]
MDFMRSIFISATGLRAQSGRMRIIAENIANANSTANAPGNDPYRRRITTFQTRFDRELQATVVNMGNVRTDQSDFTVRNEPGHPAADPQGNVKYPNVNPLIETVDMREAQRSYEANLNVITATRRMIARTIEILKA